MGVWRGRASILLSGIMIATIGAAATWQMTWWISAAVTCLLAVGACNLPTATPDIRSLPQSTAAHRQWFAALWTSYSLEGTGYIIAGT